MTLVSGKWQYKVYVDIRGGFLENGVERQWGNRKRRFLSAFGRYVFGNKTNSIILYYLEPRRLFTNTKIPDIEWSLNSLLAFWLFLRNIKIAILWHGPFQTRWQGAGCSKEPW